MFLCTKIRKSEKNRAIERCIYACDFCHVEFESCKLRNDKKHFCSPSKTGRHCYRKFLHEKSTLNLICEVCGIQYQRIKCQKTKTCGSKQCRVKILPQTSKDVSKWVTVTCEICDKTVEKRKRDKGKYPTCGSRECQSKSRALNCQFDNIRSFKQGFYKKRYSEENVKYDSSWELHRMKELDYSERDVDNPVTDWKRCDFVIPYVDVTGMQRSYNPDFYVERLDNSVTIEEVKGELTEEALCKIKAGKQFCESKGWKFQVISEPRQFTGPEIKLRTYKNDYGVFTRPKPECSFMMLALMIAEHSTCLRKKVGAVFTDVTMSMAFCLGYNGDVRGGDNQCDSLEPGSCGCTHAEINALTKNNFDIKGAYCFVTLSPCLACAKILINRQIAKVIYYETYRNASGLALLRKHDVETVKYCDITDEVKLNLDDAYVDEQRAFNVC